MYSTAPLFLHAIKQRVNHPFHFALLINNPTTNSLLAVGNKQLLPTIPIATMAALSADARTMADLLAALTHPDTNAIRQAEVALKPLLKKKECVPILVEVIKARETLVRFDCDRINWLIVMAVFCCLFEHKMCIIENGCSLQSIEMHQRFNNINKTPNRPIQMIIALNPTPI